MNNINIFENWLPEHYFDELKYTFLDQSFNWNFNEVSVYPSDKEKNDPQEYQFSHVIYANSKPRSDTYDLCSQLISRLGANILLKVKVNLNPSTKQIREKSFHTDIPVLTTKNIQYKTGIFYINNNDGYTKFKTGEIISSVENRFVIFDGDLPHCGSTCTNQKRRVVLNLNWI
jgi:hypothetical protein